MKACGMCKLRTLFTVASICHVVFFMVVLLATASKGCASEVCSIAPTPVRLFLAATLLNVLAGTLNSIVRYRLRLVDHDPRLHPR
jgi:hypothetical protein